MPNCVVVQGTNLFELLAYFGSLDYSFLNLGDGGLRLPTRDLCFDEDR